MLQRFLYYFVTGLLFIGALYLAFWIWWLILPLFLILFAFATFRVYQARKMWNDLLKQSAKATHAHRSQRKVVDDNVIDVEYEEIKSNG